MKIESFKTDNRISPIGIDNRFPVFSWNFRAEGYSPQKMYRITVSRMDFGKSDMWDSGNVASGESIGIVYEGKSLDSSCIYYVTLSVTAQDGTSSTISSTFETGLLDAACWKGTWAGTHANFQGNTTVIRKVFELERGDIVRARAYVLGLGYHELFINGRKVGKDVLSPSMSDFGKRMYYKTYDITDFLQYGKNCISAEMGYGWYGRKVAKIQFFVEFSDLSKYENATAYDGTWWVGGGAYKNNSIYGGEILDGSLLAQKKDWKDQNTDIYLDDDFMIAFFPFVENSEYRADFLEPIRVREEYPPVSVKCAGKGRYIYDFGVNISGWVRIKVRGKANDSVTIRFAEETDEHGCINQINLRSAKGEDTYILSGLGAEEYIPRFTYHGFRYAEITVKGSVKVLEASAQSVHMDLHQTGFFECSDPYLNRLHAVVLRTELNNIHSVMTDCPQRDERIAWLNDLTPRLFQNVLNFDMSAMLAKTAIDITDTQDEEGAIADTAPFMGGIRPADPVSVSYLLCGDIAYRYYGDKTVIEKNYIYYKKWVQFLLEHSDAYVPDFEYYGDWVVAECYEETDKRYIAAVFLFWHLKLMKKFAKILDLENDFRYYHEQCLSSAASIDTLFFDSKNICYANDTQTANAFALCLGLADEKYKERLLARVAEDIERRGYHCTAGNQGYRPLFYEMCDAGYLALMLKVLKNPEYPGWGYMLANGATTVWERWEKTLKAEMHSHDHPMFTAFDGIFYRNLAGIRVAEDAFACDKIMIEPDFETDISYVNCTFKTVRGAIVCNWRKQGNTVKVHIEIPPSVSAALHIAATERTVSCGCYDLEVEL